MKPRPYRMERRRAVADQNRQRIIKAARELLAADERSVRFSIEEVARRAGVARMTVYYQFGSLGGLLEGLCDSLAMAGGMQHLAEAFQLKDPLVALNHFIAVFTGFWDSDREVLRSLGALAVLDPDFAAVLEQRYGWRRKAVRALLEQIGKQTGRPRPRELNEAADVLYTLTGFSTYDTLAGTTRSREQVTALLQRLARRLLT